MSRKKVNVTNLTQIGLFTALIVVFSQISIPLPLGVPLTLQTFIIPVAGIVLGSKNGVISVLLYILLGAMGLPVFSNFRSGLGHIIGPLGGFILSFPIMAFLAGFKASAKNKFLLPVCLILGSSLNFLAGMLWFMVVTQVSLTGAFYATVLPFIPTGLLSMMMALIVGRAIRKRLH